MTRPPERGGSRGARRALSECDDGRLALHTHVTAAPGSTVPNVAGINNGTFVPRTTTADSVSTFRFRVQRDF